MNTTQITAAAQNAVDAFGSTAHSAIGLYREGGERLGQLAAQRWDRAFREASPKLKPETRRNAAHARKVFAGYYRRGLQVSASGAEVVVDTLVGAAATGIERASSFVEARAGRA